MDHSESKLDENEFDTVLLEIEGLASSAKGKLSLNDASAEEILEEFLTIPHPKPPQSHQNSGEGKKIRAYSLTWITLFLFCAFFGGTVFGFFWGKKMEISRTIPQPHQEIRDQVSIWIEKLTHLYEILEPLQPQEIQDELLEPILPPSELECLAPAGVASFLK